jgi:hypothetical protein
VFAQQHEYDLKWRTLKTEHFSVHFPEGFEATGQEIAQICEDVYEPVSRSLNYYPHRTHVVIHTRSDIANGFVVQIPWRMELFINEPQDNLIGSREAWLRILITHEFTHIVQARKTKGLSRLSYPFFGELNSFWHNATPNWYVEGFATLNETRYTLGGRGRNAFHRMKWLAPVQNQKPWKLANSNFPSRKRLPPDINYVTGFFLSEHISQVYGDDAWAKIADRYFSNPLLGFGNAVKKVTGKKPEALYREVLADFTPQSTSHDSTVSPSKIWRRPSVPENQLSPHWLDDNKIVYYRASFDDLPEIAILHRNGASQRMLRRALFGTENVLDTGMRSIVWAETRPHLRYPATEYSDLMIYDRQTRATRRLTKNARVYSPDLSPDENLVVAVQTNLPQNQLVAISTETGEMTPILSIQNASLQNPRWSPDGTSVAFAIKDSTAKQDIAILDFQTGKWRLLYDADASHDNSPCWTPDSKYVLYTSDRSGVFNIWAVEIATGKQWLVTNERTGAFSPDVSPDGKSLAYTVYSELGFLVASIELDQSKWTDASTSNAEWGVRNSELNSPESSALRIPSSEFTTGSYSALGQILRPQGWFPWAVEDEDGTAFGLFAFSADVLHRHDWQGFLTFSPANLQPSWDIAYNYRRWWSELTIRSFSDVDQISGVLFEGQVFNRWLRNRGLEITTGIPLTLESNVNTTFLRPSFGYKGENVDLTIRSAGLDTSLHIGDYRGLKAGLQFFRGSQTLRDVVPHKAILFSAFADWSVSYLKTDFKAQQYTGILNMYHPTFIKHHQLQLQFNYTARGGNFGFDSFRSYPIGYGDPGNRKLFRFKAAYHFPLSYLEWQMPLLPIFVGYLAGTLFFDWGTAWNHGLGKDVWRRNDRSSSGVLLSANLHLFQTINTQAGVAIFYRDAEGDVRIEPVIGINF